PGYRKAQPCSLDGAKRHPGRLTTGEIPGVSLPSTRATTGPHVLLLVSPRCWPQSMRSASPVIVVAPSTRNNAATATSLGQIPRLSGYWVFAAAKRSWYCSSLRILRVQAPSMPPGQSALTRTSGASARAVESVRLLIAAFDAV